MMTNAASSQPQFIGIDVAQPVLRAAVINNAGEVIERREAPLDHERVVAQDAEIVSALRNPAAQITTVGVPIPGLVNRFTDRVVASTELPNMVREELHA